jgi:hypothetical protein
MSTGRHAFKHNDAARLIRAAKAAGLKVASVELVGDKVRVLVGEAPPESKSEQPPNSWDKIIDAQDQKRTP